MQGTILARNDAIVLFRATDQRIWRVATSEIDHIVPTSSRPLDKSQLRSTLAVRFPRSQIADSEHYLIVSDLDSTTNDTACRLLEKVYTEFFSFWRELGWELSEPPEPLVVVLLSNPVSYGRQLVEEFGVGAAWMPSFYGLQSNWVVVQADVRRQNGAWDGGRQKSSLSSLTTGNVVHEATHQLMMNSGMQARSGNNPLWVSEGVAVYFEATSDSADLGWRRPGEFNARRMPLLRSAVDSLSRDDIARMLGSDQVFRDTGRSSAYYSLAWGWNHFLFHRHRQAYVEYLQELSQSSPLQAMTADQRVEEFSRHFDESLDVLVGQFRRYCSKIR